MTKDNLNAAEFFTVAGQTRINSSILSQALREIIHAVNASIDLNAKRTAEILALTETDTAKTPELLVELRNGW